MVARIRGAKEQVEGQNAKDVYCPKCRRLLMRKYTDAAGHIDCRCTKCGEVFVVDLFSWRRSFS
jgi:phage FluMu protein Com